MTTPPAQPGAHKPSAETTKARSPAVAKGAPRAPRPTRGTHASRDLIKVSFITLPAAVAEVVGAMLVFNYASDVALDMVAAIHVTAFVMSVLLIGIYHVAHQVESRLLRFLALSGKLILNGAMVLVLWDLHLPHRVFGAHGFTTTESADALLAGAILVGCSFVAVALHWLVVSRLKRLLALVDLPGGR